MFQWLLSDRDALESKIASLESELKLVKGIRESLGESLGSVDKIPLLLSSLDQQSKLLNEAMQQIAELRTMVETPERRIPKVMPRKWSQFRDAVEAPNGNL